MSIIFKVFALTPQPILLRSTLHQVRLQQAVVREPLATFRTGVRLPAGVNALVHPVRFGRLEPLAARFALVLALHRVRRHVLFEGSPGEKMKKLQDFEGFVRAK